MGPALHHAGLGRPWRRGKHSSRDRQLPAPGWQLELDEQSALLSGAARDNGALVLDGGHAGGGRHSIRGSSQGRWWDQAMAREGGHGGGLLRAVVVEAEGRGGVNGHYPSGQEGAADGTWDG